MQNLSNAGRASATCSVVSECLMIAMPQELAAKRHQRLPQELSNAGQGHATARAMGAASPEATCAEWPEKLG